MGIAIQRTPAQIQQEIEARTDDCVENHKRAGFNFLKSRADLRPGCEAQVRQDYQAEIDAAHGREGSINQSINEAAANLAGGWDPKLFAILGGVLVFLIIIVIIFKK